MKFGSARQEDDDEADIEIVPIEGTPTKRGPSLGSLAEKKAKKKQAKSSDNSSPFWSNPITLIFMALLAVTLTVGAVFGFYLLVSHLA